MQKELAGKTVINSMNSLPSLLYKHDEKSVIKISSCIIQLTKKPSMYFYNIPHPQQRSLNLSLFLPSKGNQKSHLTAPENQLSQIVPPQQNLFSASQNRRPASQSSPPFLLFSLLPFYKTRSNVEFFCLMRCVIFAA